MDKLDHIKKRVKERKFFIIRVLEVSLLVMLVILSIILILILK